MKKFYMNKYLLIIAIIINASISYANPKGGTIVSGDAKITRDTKKLNIHQTSNKAVINWRSFDIKVNEHTEFHQPNHHSTTLNIINDIKPSDISGKLTANGNIVLVNPNGVFFNKKSQVDVNGIVATTTNINPVDFMQGANKFNIPSPKDNAKVINKGIITAKEAGLVGLVAPQVENHGVIQATLGKVHIASGDVFTLDLYGDDLLNVAVHDDQVKSQLIKNTGTILAHGGNITIASAAAKNTINSLIKVNGLIEATSISQEKSGAITIAAAGTNKTDKSGKSCIEVTGTINASGINKEQQGGKIEILADHISISNTAKIDASGHSAKNVHAITKDGNSATIITKGNTSIVRKEGDFLLRNSRAGGSIKIGGDYLGQGKVQTAKTLFVDEQAQIINNAIYQGDAGRTILWADGITYFSGNVDAIGGVYGGNGGFLETSGKKQIIAKGNVNLSNRASGFNKGTHLLDPDNITIHGNVDINFAATNSSINLLAKQLLWLDAADATTITDTGGEVNIWADKSSNHNNATPSSGREPITGDKTINGLNALDFTEDTLALASGIESTDRTFLFVASSDDISSTRFYASGSSINIQIRTLSGGEFNYAAGNGVNEYNTGGSSGNIGSGFSIPANTPHIVGISFFNNLTFHYNGDINVSTARVNSGLNAPINRIGSRINSYFDGLISEVISLDNPSTEEIQVTEQYLSQKWNIALTPPGTGGDEVTKATANDGYSHFTTRYLEKLSNNSNIILAATNDINLDLQTDTLHLADDQNFSLTTTNGNIATLSDGSIMTNRIGSGGNITFTAGGAGNINLDHQLTLNAQNGGSINMSSGGSNINVNDTLDVTTDSLNITSNFSGTSSFIYSQATAGNSLDIGSGGSGAIVLDDTLINNVKAGFSTYSFGRTDGGNIVNRTSTWDGAVTFLTNGNFTNDIASSSDDTVTVTAGGNIILNQDLSTTSATVNAIQLNATNNFTNNAGSDALSATNSNWVVYSNDPATNQNNGLLPDESLYGQANIATAIGNATLGNNLYAHNTATQPTITYNVDNNSVIYGNAVIGNGITYASGLVGDDTEGTIGQTGAAGINDGYTIGDDVGTYSNQITATAGTLANLLGYQYAFTPGDLTVNTASLTISGVSAQDKVYDTNNSATLTGGSLVGVLGGDTVTVNGGSGNFSQVDVANNIPVTASNIILGGVDGGNYVISSLPMSLTANITPASVSISGVIAQDKVFDGTTDATLVGGSLIGVLGGDDVTLTAGTGTFIQAEVGNDITVTTTGYSIGGAKVGNYTLSGQPNGITANILDDLSSESVTPDSVIIPDGVQQEISSQANTLLEQSSINNIESLRPELSSSSSIYDIIEVDDSLNLEIPDSLENGQLPQNDTEKDDNDDDDDDDDDNE